MLDHYLEGECFALALANNLRPGMADRAITCAGQRDILQSLIEFANEKDASARRSAEEQGYPIIDEDEDGISGSVKMSVALSSGSEKDSEDEDVPKPP